MPTIRETLKSAAERLERAGVPDAAYDAAALLSHLTGEGPLSLRADAGRSLSPDTLERFSLLVARRERREPLQYILGEAWFMGLRLSVAPGVLIPRYDTETLCEAALRRVTGREKILDLCTGSGALAVALAARFPETRVFAGDISQEAIALAARNAARHQAKIDLRRGDLFAPFAGERFDLIVSNPPYIPQGELAGLQQEVRQEPALALDGGPDGLDFYRRIIAETPQFLPPGGWLLLEIGSDQAAAVTALLAKDFQDIRVYQDLNGLDRAVEGRL